MELLGSPIWGPPQFYDAFLSVQFDKIVAIQDKLVDLEDPQVELHLLKSCLSVCKVTHLLCCVPSSSLGSFPSHFDLRLRECLSRILCCEISDSSWTQATLPFRLGGLGLRESGRSAAPAFVGSCNSAHILVSRLVETFDVFMPFPGEDCSLAFFKDMSVSVLHKDFHLGHPAYFDFSVRSTTQSAVISSASSQAGVAAAVGEIAKDTQYQDIVNDNGRDFIPLVCETFGVWSPYALSILGSIADRTTVRNGLPRKFATRQLLQQLFVTLWRYNAKMILHQYSLTAEDEFSDFNIG